MLFVSFCSYYLNICLETPYIFTKDLCTYRSKFQTRVSKVM